MGLGELSGRDLTKLWSKNLCQYPLLFKERRDIALSSEQCQSIFLFSSLVFTKDQVNLLLGLVTKGYVLGGASSQAFNEGSFYESKSKTKVHR